MLFLILSSKQNDMKKQLIGALVAALILFIWQFISFGPMNIHAKQMDYLPQQDAILEALAANNVAEGEYFMPRMPLDASMEEAEARGLENTGKPWAQIRYHHDMQNTMGSNLFRGFIIDFLSAFLLVWMLMRMRDLDMKTAVFSSLAVGTIGYLTLTYLDSIWFKSNSIPQLIDTVVQWGLCGTWLGWWLTRE